MNRFKQLLIFIWTLVTWTVIITSILPFLIVSNFTLYLFNLYLLFSEIVSLGVKFQVYVFFRVTFKVILFLNHFHFLPNQQDIFFFL